MATGPPSAPDRVALAARIQGFGNVNPPPLEEDTAGTVAKKAVGRLGNIVGEEVMLTVEDFKEKGAVGAVKDAVADAGDILIDGVAAVFGWIRGDPPPEEEDPAAEDATKALSNGPSGAAYGISQASPTGGINAVWVMPNEADPATLAQLAAESNVTQYNDPRVPKNILPYQPPPSAAKEPQFNRAAGATLPGGPLIAPYQPAPGGPMIAPYQPAAAGARPPPFVPGAAPSAATGPGRWGPSGYSSGSTPSQPSGGGSGQSGVRSLVERIAKGEVIYGPETAKRLVGQCNATKVTSKQFADIVCERARRFYLGLEGDADADSALVNLLGLTHALADQSTPFATEVVKEIKAGVHEELMSLRCSAKHKAAADPMLAALGLPGGDSTQAAAAGSTADLLGGSVNSASTTATAPIAPEADLLAWDSSGGVAPLSLGTSEAALFADTGNSSGAAAWELSGLSMDVTIPTPTEPAIAAAAQEEPASSGKRLTAGDPALTALASLSGAAKQEQKDAFSFVGDELSKASTTKP